MLKYGEQFDLVDTEEQAKSLCQKYNSLATSYIRKNHPAGYTPWHSDDGSENKFVVWSYVKKNR